MCLPVEKRDYLATLATLHGLDAKPLKHREERYVTSGTVSAFDDWRLQRAGRYSWLSLDELIYDYCCFYGLGGLGRDSAHYYDT